MHPQIESLLDVAESRYLQPEELNNLTQYVDSLPQRLEAYRCLRDQEIAVVQQVADQLQVEMPLEEVANLERSLRNALLVMRYSAMAMLLNDESFLKNRLLGWLSQNTEAYNTRSIDTVLYRLLNQRLSQALTDQQMRLLEPSLTLAQNTLLSSNPIGASA